MISYLHETMQKAFFRLTRYWHCHQLPERSFFVRGRQVPMCARCTGLLVGAVLFPLFEGQHIAVYVGLVSAFIVDSLTQLYGLRESNNALRFALGLGFASSILALLVGARR
jgi:uncharacterized membrane protein